jgi:hypothetical protein
LTCGERKPPLLATPASIDERGRRRDKGYEVHAAKPEGEGALKVRDGEPGPHQR